MVIYKYIYINKEYNEFLSEKQWFTWFAVHGIMTVMKRITLHWFKVNIFPWQVCQEVRVTAVLWDAMMWNLIDKYWHSSEPAVFIFSLQQCEEVVVTLMTNDYCWKVSYILWYLFFTFFNGWMMKWIEDQNYYVTLFFLDDIESVSMFGE